MHTDHPMTDAEIVKEAAIARAMYEAHALRAPAVASPDPLPWKENSCS